MTTASTLQRNAMNDAGNAAFEVGTGAAFLRIQNTSDENLAIIYLNDDDVMDDSAEGAAALNDPSVTEYGADATWFGGTNPISVLSEATPTDRTATHGWVTNRNGVNEEKLALSELGLSPSAVIPAAVNVTFSSAPTITQRATPA